MRWHFSFTAFRYLLFELLPSFILGSLVFIFIILMFQGLKLAEFALIHGVDGKTLAEMLFYMTIGLLPALLPMSLVFSIVLTFARLSGDSEIIALNASGVNLTQVVFPALLLGAATGILSAQLSSDFAPRGNRRFEVLISQLGHSKAAINLKEGTFMDGFFNLVVYASKVHPGTGELEHIFIYDERQTPPMTIIAKTGSMTQDAKITGQNVLLELREGDIHRKTNTHTKINFGKFFISLSESYHLQERDKSLMSFTLEELKTRFEKKQGSESELRTFEIEYHRRIAVAFACLIFSLLGAAVGINNQKRSGRGSGIVWALIAIVAYWILLVGSESLARSTVHPAGLLIWIPNMIFGTLTLWQLKAK